MELAHIILFTNIILKLTREDTATDGDVSSERAFLVNVSALNSLKGREKKNLQSKNGQMYV